MPGTRSSGVAVDIARAARLFHALSDETRLEIMRCLAGGERCVCELTDDLEAAQSRLSFHLKTLKDAGLVSDRRDGRWVYYTLDHDLLEEAAGVLEALQEPPQGRGPGCC